jgi:hypothetical protein
MRLELPVLFPARLRQIERIVVGLDDDFAGAGDGIDHVRDVEAERRIATAVVAEPGAVDPYVGGVVDRTELEEQPLAGSGTRHFDVPPIPGHAVQAGVRDAARERLRRERNPNPIAPLDLFGGAPRALGVDGELPLAVQ